MYNRRQGKAKGPAAARSRWNNGRRPLIMRGAGAFKLSWPIILTTGPFITIFPHLISPKMVYQVFPPTIHQRVSNPELYKVQQIQFTAWKLIGQFKLCSLGKTELYCKKFIFCFSIELKVIGVPPYRKGKELQKFVFHDKKWPESSVTPNKG